MTKRHHYDAPSDGERLYRSDLRAEVWDKTGGRCWYCGMQMNPWRDFSIDHFIPRSAGGAEDLSNLVPCCRACNTRKQGRPLERLRQLLGQTGSPQFSAEQIAYLQRQGIAVPGLGAYRFYFEQIEAPDAA